MISVVVPCYDMENRGVEFLGELLRSVVTQFASNYEMIVSDDSTGDDIKSLCERWGAQWIKGKPGAAANLNNAINHATGDIIKPMFQDDKFIDVGTLARISDEFMFGAKWLACTSHNEGSGYPTSVHVPYPHTTIKNLREGENTYGSPSAMAWRANDMRFDENLQWLFDCEFYARMAEKYGVPALVDSPVFIRQWPGQATYTMATGSVRIADSNYVIGKYR